MGVEKGPEYYDNNVTRVNLPLEESPWGELYQMAASLLPPPEDCSTVVDLGCGTGRFAKLLCDRGYTKYWGIDFSEVRIREARRYVPDFEFSVANVFDEWVQEKLRKFNLFILLEVLEHVNDDLKLLSTLPSDSRVVFSVPNYDSAGHVRFFRISDDVTRRYEETLDFSNGGILRQLKKKRRDRTIYVFSCVKC
jgi:trans-aconitate methyltransferase